MKRMLELGGFDVELKIDQSACHDMAPKYLTVLFIR